MLKRSSARSSMLLEMLRYRRPAGSRTEREFVTRYLDSVPGMIDDPYGNRMYLHPRSRTVIACHTDTVHRIGGKQRVQQQGAVVRLHPKESTSNCLGADDTAGVYACLRMIKVKVPVSFIFHRAEEVGGKGSTYMANRYASWFEQNFDRVVSLDRRGTTDIITEQLYGECCSDQFAWALADALDMGHEPASGTFTDSANYTHLVPECTNVSVGYRHEHSREECLDVVYLEALIARLCAVDWEGLPTARDRYALSEAPLTWGWDGLTQAEWAYRGAK